MKRIIRYIKSLVGIYEPGYEYWIKLKDIHIRPSFRWTMIGKKKYKRKWQFYHRNGYCESKIILDKTFTLVDGYSSYKILKTAEGIDTKIPVYFTD